MKLVREVASSEAQSCMKEAQALEQNPASIRKNRRHNGQVGNVNIQQSPSQTLPLLSTPLLSQCFWTLERIKWKFNSFL